MHEASVAVCQVIVTGQDIDHARLGDGQRCVDGEYVGVRMLRPKKRRVKLAIQGWVGAEPTSSRQQTVVLLAEDSLPDHETRQPCPRTLDKAWYTPVALNRVLVEVVT